MTALEMIAAERARQVTEEGYTPAHDDTHDDGALAAAAACFAVGSDRELYYLTPDQVIVDDATELWPWADDSGNALAGKDRLRQLVIAGALIVAEIERLQRSADPTLRGYEPASTVETED